MSSAPYLIADIGGIISITGLPANIIAAATAIQTRIVTADDQAITEWIDQTDQQNGNDWSNNLVAAYFSANDLTIPSRSAQRAEIHIRVTTPTATTGYRTGPTIDIVVTDPPPSQ